MRSLSLTPAALVLLALGCGASPELRPTFSEARAPLDDDARELAVHGLAGFSVDGDGTWVVRGGPGYVATARTYRNVEVTVRVRARGNSGVFVRGAHAPGFPSGVEAQIDARGVPWATGALYDLAAAQTTPPIDGAWFTLCVAVVGDEAVTAIDGARSARARLAGDVARRAGFVAFQGHDPVAEVRFRDVRIRALTDDDSLDAACGGPRYSSP